jgi:hypothetical protein
MRYVVTFNHPSVLLGTYWDLIKKSVYFFFFFLEACQSKAPKTIFEFSAFYFAGKKTLAATTTCKVLMIHKTLSDLQQC